MTPSAAIAIWLTLVFATGSASARGEDYAAAVAAVERGMVEVNTDPTQGIAALQAALTELHEFAPLLANDAEALELRTMAELTLARAQLAAGEREAAAATLDATLEGLAGAPLPTERLGPSLGALVDERRRALAARGEARLRVRCAVPCRVYVDERGAPRAQGEGLLLPLGEHRLWIEPRSGAQAEEDHEDLPPLRTSLTLSEPGAALTLIYPETGEAAPPSSPAPAPGPAPAPAMVGPAPGGEAIDGLDRPRTRLAPRWVELTSIAVGGAALIAGAVLWSIDSTCPGGVDPNDIVACPELYDTRAAGIALVSAGAAAGLTGGVLLIVDETRRGDRRGHELALTWTTRF